MSDTEEQDAEQMKQDLADHLAYLERLEKGKGRTTPFYTKGQYLSACDPDEDGDRPPLQAVLMPGDEGNGTFVACTRCRADIRVPSDGDDYDPVCNACRREEDRVKEKYSTLKTVETDPHKVDPHSPGAKLDAGKPRVGLVLKGFSRALMAVAEVGTFGANKYTEDGWLEVPNGVARYTDAMGRHLLQEDLGPRDADSGCLHAAQVCWNSLARLELMLREGKIK